jgi:biopolymer transport protein TolR
MAMSGGGDPNAVKSDINITPLVDVMLVLLIIFMVVTPMLQKGQAVLLPLANNPDRKPDDKSQIMVVLTADRSPSGWVAGAVWIDKDKFTDTQFKDKIKEAFDRNPSGQVMVKADAKLTYGDVKGVVLQVRDAGFKSVGLIASKRDTAQPGKS